MKALIASFVMALAIWILGAFHIFNMLVILLVATPTYFGVATLLRTIPREDVLTLSKAIRRKSSRALPGAEKATVPEVTP
jgi:hypothetical protein